MLTFRTLENMEQLEAAYSLMRQLRPHLSFEQFVDLTAKAKKANDYELRGGYWDGELAAVMGFRTIHDLVHGTHLYIDDLIVDPKLQSKGIGAQMLKEAERCATERGCDNLRLCTGIENEDGKRFYDREGWTLRAVAYKKKV